MTAEEELIDDQCDENATETPNESAFTHFLDSAFESIQRDFVEYRKIFSKKIQSIEGHLKEVESMIDKITEELDQDTIINELLTQYSSEEACGNVEIRADDVR